MGFNLNRLWEEADWLPEAYRVLAPSIARLPHVGRRFPFSEGPSLQPESERAGRMIASLHD